jgi:hypothetical protein
MKTDNPNNTTYSGSTVGYVMMGMIEEKYTAVPLSAVGTWLAFKSDCNPCSTVIGIFLLLMPCKLLKL